ncbi:MAG: SCO family protein [Planctomycetia bacterium]|jgi:cytochrome oxidase Cu insertion factor (SCO1/SenC/PrrC family)
MQMNLVTAPLRTLVVVASLVGCQKAPERAIDRPLGAKSEQEAPLPVAGRIEPDEEGRGVAITDLPFTLTDQQGQPFDSKSLAGKVWMGAIFFANCPGPCFRENQAIADILRKIDDPDFMVVSLTCDPDNDTPDMLRRYADRFEADPARWKFLTGDMAVIKRVANEGFKLPAEVGVHSERGVVFDRAGRLRGGYHLLQPDRVELLEKLIRDVLAEKGEPAAAFPVEQATP